MTGGPTASITPPPIEPSASVSERLLAKIYGGGPGPTLSAGPFPTSEATSGGGVAALTETRIPTPSTRHPGASWNLPYMERRLRRPNHPKRNPAAQNTRRTIVPPQSPPHLNRMKGNPPPMRTDLLPIIACPICQASLTLQPEAAAIPNANDADTAAAARTVPVADTDTATARTALVADTDGSRANPAAPASAAEILSGALTCPPCGAHYPIADGIPNLLPPELRNTPPA